MDDEISIDMSWTLKKRFEKQELTKWIFTEDSIVNINLKICLLFKIPMKQFVKIDYLH